MCGRLNLKQMVERTKMPLTEAQWSIVDEITEFTLSFPLNSDRIDNGYGFAEHIVPLCVLSDEQAWYRWSRCISGHIPTHRQFFETGDCYTETWCQLIGVTPEQKEQCREFYESSEIIQHPRRSGKGYRSIRKYAVDKMGACERILTAEQRDQWNRIKTAGPLPESWSLSSDRSLPNVPTEPTDVVPDGRPLTELATFFGLLAENREVSLTPNQTGFLERLEAIVQNALGWLRFRGRCPLTVRRDNPQEWATRELLRYAEQITKLLILTEEQVQLLTETDQPA